ncbi:MAG: acyltransferase [Polyangiaceae bacterium]|nr:acyltransferase [Polyangiaceae bacterium]
MSLTHLQYLETKRFDGLDGLRCLAILPVIVHHATPRPLAGIWGKGAVGVDLFFALSGFLITTLLVREQRAQGKVSLRLFWGRRALRIFPLYYTVLGLTLLGYAWILPADHAEREHLFDNWYYHATYTANWFANYDVRHAVPFAFSWSLCVEEQFYVFWPLLVAFVRPRALLLLVLLVLIGGDWALEHGGLAALPWLAAHQRVVTSFALPIGLGSLLALLLDGERTFRVFERFLTWRPLAPLLLGGAVVALIFPNTPYFSLCVLLTLLVGSVALQPENWLAPLLSRRWITFGGRISYAAYLTHVTALEAVRRMFPFAAQSTLFVLSVGLPLVVVLASAAHYAIERPFLGLREKNLRLQPKALLSSRHLPPAARDRPSRGR